MPSGTTLQPQTYPKLLTTIESGRKQVEHTKALTYWRVGELISKHLLTNNGRAGYGQQLYQKLSKDLNVGQRTLERTVQFHRKFPIPSARTQLDWSHYRELISVDDPVPRTRLLRKTEKNCLSTEIRSGKGSEKHRHSERSEESLTPRFFVTESDKQVVPQNDVVESGLQPSVRFLRRGSTRRVTPKFPKLKATKGALYIYQIIKPTTVKPANGKVLVDCGFDLWAQFGKGSAPKVVDYLSESGLTPKYVTTRKEMSFTYQVYVEKIIDGDTFWAHIGKIIKINRARVNQLVAPIVRAGIVFQEGTTRGARYGLAVSKIN